MPTHYEPLESPVHNALYSRDTNPAVNWFTRQENRFAPPGDPRFPFVLTTYRLTEHHTAGGMSRFLSHLAELQPELFAEMSPELARELKIDNGDYISIVSLRGAIEARALVSRRMRPMQLNGKTVHQIAMPFHFGSAGPVRGGATNDLSSDFGRAERHDHGSEGAARATSCPAGCRAVPLSKIGSKNTCRRVARLICIRNNRRPVRPCAEPVVVTAWKERSTIDDRRRTPEHESAQAYLRAGSRRSWFLHRSRLFASAAKLAKSRAKNGTKCPTTASPGREIPTTTPAISAHRPGDTSCSWNRICQKEIRSPVPMSLAAIEDPFRWVFLSDVCKHCEEAGCLEACPTGSIVRTEVGTVLVQNDVCNGCGYCVVSCPFGVIDRRPEPLPDAGGAFKCTFCYDRQKSGLVPACAKVCPTESIVFGRLDDLRARGAERVQQLQQAGYNDAQLYDPTGNVCPRHSRFFLILGEPEAYGLPPKPQIPTIYLKSAWTAAFATAIASIIATLLAFAFSS